MFLYFLLPRSWILSPVISLGRLQLMVEFSNDVFMTRIFYNLQCREGRSKSTCSLYFGQILKSKQDGKAVNGLHAALQS